MEQSTVQLPEWIRVAEVELVYKTKIKASKQPKVNSSRDIDFRFYPNRNLKENGNWFKIGCYKSQ